MADEEILEGEILEGEILEGDIEALPVEGEVLDTLEADEITELRGALADAERSAAENLDGWQRSQATLANYRKRVEAERQEWEAMATAGLITRLLPVLDDFERAFANLPETLREQSWLDGITLIEAKVRRILETEGVMPIVVTPGEPFDPFYHQAITAQETSDVEDGCLLVEVQRGYLLNARVLRPALVVVAKAPPAADAETLPEEPVVEAAA